MPSDVKRGLYRGCRYEQDLKGSIGPKYQKVLDLVGWDRMVLEVGCHTGYLGELLAMRRNRVWGVEINEEAARQAGGSYERVIIGDVEDEALWSRFPKDFDVILLLDVLEHLVDPWKLLDRSKEILRPEGFLLITLPNIAFYSVRKDLLRGRFEYQDSGILDRTHLRFFDFHSARKLIEGAGYRIEGWWITSSELPLEYRFPLLGRLYNPVRQWLERLFPNLFGAVILYKAVR